MAESLNTGFVASPSQCNTLDPGRYASTSSAYNLISPGTHASLVPRSVLQLSLGLALASPSDSRRTDLGTRFYRRSTEQSGGGPMEVEDAFRLISTLSNGDHSKVYVAVRVDRSSAAHDHDSLAMRLMSKAWVTPDMACTELKVLRLCVNSPFISQLQGCFQTPTRYGVMLSCPTVSQGSLYTRVKRYHRFSEIVARFYMAEVAEGLFYLHDRAIIHRNLTLDNILIKDNGHIVLSDFELSYVGDKSRDLPDIPCGTWHGFHVPQMPAPEIFEGRAHNKMVDWWSFGIVLYRLICGRYPPLKNCGNVTIQTGSMTNIPVLTYAPEPYPANISPVARTLLLKLLIRSYMRRLGQGEMEREEIRGAEFFQPVEWSMVVDQTIPPPFTDVGQVPPHTAQSHFSMFRKSWHTVAIDM